jgi:rod shape-determining protein MreD
MKKFLLYILLSYIALSVQSIFLKGIRPDFVLILVCFYSLRQGLAKGVAFGAVAGLLTDIASGFLIGPNIISKALAALLVRTFRENLFQWNIFINTFVITALAVLDIFLVYICIEFFSKISFSNRSFDIAIMQIFFTTAAAAVLYFFFNPGRNSHVKTDTGR